MPHIQLPQPAVDALSTKAASLLEAIIPTTPPVQRVPTDAPGSMGQHRVAGHFVVGENATLVGPVMSFDGFNEFQGLEIHRQDIHATLSEEGITAFQKLVADVARRREFRDVCSTKYLTRHLAQWIETSTLHPDTPPWATVLLDSLAADVSERRILVPLDGFDLSRSFRLGHVEFSYFTDRDIERLAGPPLPDQNENLLYRERLTSQYLGRVYASTSVLAEGTRAAEIAVDRSEASLNILRFLDPAAADVRVRSFIGRFGQVDPGVLRTVEAPPDALWLSERSQRPSRRRTLLDDEFLTVCGPVLTVADSLLRSDTLSPFDTSLLNAIGIYARGVVSPEPSDRLLRAFTSVESLLLVSDNEPIVHSLGIRLAFINGRTAEERREYRSIVQDGYALRSKFSHHGRSAREIERVNRALDMCSRTLFLILTNPRPTSKEELLRSIEDRMFA
jgi:hypothetical protein